MKNNEIFLLGALLVGGVLLSKKSKATTVQVVQPIKFSYPIKAKITSAFGNRVHPLTGKSTLHNGIDIAAAVGTKVMAPADGIVTSTYSNATGGDQMIIKHPNGFTTGYAHLNRFIATTGQTVKQGQAIAESGKTGAITGPHLHFTLKDATGEYIDPAKVLV